MSFSPPPFLSSKLVLLLLCLSATLDFDEVDVVVVLIGIVMMLGVLSPISSLATGSSSVVKVMVVVVVMVAIKSNVFQSSAESFNISSLLICILRRNIVRLKILIQNQIHSRCY